MQGSMFSLNSTNNLINQGYCPNLITKGNKDQKGCCLPQDYRVQLAKWDSPQAFLSRSLPLPCTHSAHHPSLAEQVEPGHVVELAPLWDPFRLSGGPRPISAHLLLS